MNESLKTLLLVLLFLPAVISFLYGGLYFWRHSKPSLVRSASGTTRWMWSMRFALFIALPMILVLFVVTAMTQPIPWMDSSAYIMFGVMFLFFFVPPVLLMRVHLSNQSRIHETYDYLTLPPEWKPPSWK